ncbi:hypothetical protein [Nitrincola lacisaponensis]|nr:hypothetical protein [Nitrincola lacisaponensis]
MKYLRKLALTVCCLFSLSLHAETAGRVVSVMPVVHLIAQELLQDTGIDVVFLAPERLPINRISGWLRRVDSQSLTEADVVITVESVWPSLELYPLMRTLSIRTIPIDLATELSPGGARVLMRPDAALESEFFWLDLNNLTQMINVAARDLGRVWPEHATTIDQNRFALQRAIQQTQIRIDNQLAESGVTTLSLADERLMPLAYTLGIPLVADAGDLLMTSTPEPDTESIWVIETLQRLSVGSLPEWLVSLEAAIQVNRP